MVFYNKTYQQSLTTACLWKINITSSNLHLKKIWVWFCELSLKSQNFPDFFLCNLSIPQPFSSSTKCLLFRCKWSGAAAITATQICPRGCSHTLIIPTTTNIKERVSPGLKQIIIQKKNKKKKKMETKKVDLVPLPTTPSTTARRSLIVIFVLGCSLTGSDILECR